MLFITYKRIEEIAFAQVVYTDKEIHEISVQLRLTKQSECDEGYIYWLFS